MCLRMPPGQEGTGQARKLLPRATAWGICLDCNFVSSKGMKDVEKNFFVQLINIAMSLFMLRKYVTCNAGRCFNEKCLSYY